MGRNLKGSLEKHILLAFLLAFALTALNAIVSFQNLNNIVKNANLVNHTYEVISQINLYLAKVKNAESAIRGYMVTGKQDYLNEYENAKKSATPTLNTLNQLTKDNSVQIANVEKLIPRTIEKFKIMDGLRDARIQGGFELAQQYASTGQGTVKMDEIVAITDLMITEEQRLLKIRSQQSNKSSRATQLAVAIATSANLIFIIFIYILIKRELNRRNELEQRKNEFISLASHELKTPITSMKVFTQLLRKKISEGELDETSKIIEKLDSQIYKLTELVYELLDLSRIQIGKLHLTMEFFDLNELIQDTIEAIQGTTAKHQLRYKSSVKQEVFGDRYRIYQVLVNLLTNAIKYSPTGGKINVNAQKQKSDILVSVEDKGLGIEKAHVKKIFERLYEVPDLEEKTFPGLGIGLFISQEIVNRHGGKIWVKSKFGKGSTFYFTLPIKRGKVLRKPI